MLVYRVFAQDPKAPPGESGHPDYVHRPAQGSLRLDNPVHYVTWYYGATPEGAIGESFADQQKWSDAMFETPWLPGGRRVLGVFEIPDAIPLLDLDGPNTLCDLSLRPTQVVTHTRAVTQIWALKIFQQTNHSGNRRWKGVRWWSYHRPHWTVIGMWTVEPQKPAHRLVEVQRLERGHPAVESARSTLDKDWH